MVQKIMDADYADDAEVDRPLEALDRGLDCPSGHVSGLIFWPKGRSVDDPALRTVAAFQSVQPDGELGSRLQVTQVGAADEGAERVEVPKLGEHREPWPVGEVIAVCVGEGAQFGRGPSEADALKCVGEVGLAGADGCFVPVAEPGGGAVPEGVARVGVTVDQSLAERKVEMLVRVQEFVGASEYPLAIAGRKGGAGLDDGAQSQMGAIGGKDDRGLGEPVQPAEQATEVFRAGGGPSGCG